MAHTRRAALLVSSVLTVGLLAGCAHIPNQYATESPSFEEPLASPTSQHVMANFTLDVQRTRPWTPLTVAHESPVTTHWPLYFENPFVDKGATYKYRLGDEDWIAMPYGYARYTLNWLLLPASMVVTPPWTLMESDGVLSKQLLGHDHDAIPAGCETPIVAAAPETKAPMTDDVSTTTIETSTPGEMIVE